MLCPAFVQQSKLPRLRMIIHYPHLTAPATSAMMKQDFVGVNKSSSGEGNLLLGDWVVVLSCNKTNKKKLMICFSDVRGCEHEGCLEGMHKYSKCFRNPDSRIGFVELFHDLYVPIITALHHVYNIWLFGTHNSPLPAACRPTTIQPPF